MGERVHTGERPFECPKGQRKFKLKHNYNIHMRGHSTQNTVDRSQCQICGQVFSSITLMNAHRLQHEIAAQVAQHKVMKVETTQTKLEGNLGSAERVMKKLLP